MSNIQYIPDQKTIEEIISKFTKHKLNLNPGFQRSSVWKNSDRAKLIDSIIKNYPLPSVFFYKREKDGEIIYDVIDGKQRIETILMYMGYLRGNRFYAHFQLPESNEVKKYYWKDLIRLRKQPLLNGYKLQTIEVSGDPAEIIQLFVRINSTGKALTSAEKRHANYYHSYLLKTAAKLAEKYKDYFIKYHILSRDQISRMKHVELMCELMISINSGDVINKKIVLDKVLEHEKNELTTKKVDELKYKTIHCMNRIRKMFPKLYPSRFNQLSDFYTLAVLIHKFESENLVLNNAKRNRLAWDILCIFSNGVDKVRIKQTKAESIGKGLELQRDYLLTVIQKTDDITQRRIREKILRNLIQNLFEIKDSKRAFSLEQRRLLWNTTSIKICKNINCRAGIGGGRKELTWHDFTVDHIDPYSKGGATRLENAAILCRSCNSKKRDKI